MKCTGWLALVADDDAAADMDASQRSARHPAGLTVLYLTEVWERFSFYGLKALLVLFLNSGVLEPPRFERVYGCWLVTLMFGTAEGQQAVQALSSRINQAYSGSAYLTPLIGGVVADSVLGTRSTLILGGLSMAAGHACMAYEPTFLVGLLLLVVGNGAFKPTVSALLSRLYEPPGMSSLRERGFAIFFTGINVGALLAPLVCGLLQQRIGYDAGFGAAGVGMLIGLLCFFAGSHHLPSDTEGPRGSREPLLADSSAMDAEPLDGASGGGGGSCGGGGSGSSSAGGGGSGSSSGDRGHRWRRDGMPALAGICASIIPFWVAFEQWSNVVPLFARDLTDRVVLGVAWPAAWLQSVSPMLCIALMPLVTGLWAAQSRRGTEPQPCVKMAIGCALQGSAWLVMAVGSRGVSEESKVSVMLPLSAAVLLTAGQVYVGPVGLSLVSRCCPANMKSTAIGVWFLAGGVGGLIAGPVGALYSSWSRPGFFALLCLVCYADSALVALVAPKLHRAAAASIEDGESKRKREDSLYCHELGKMQMSDEHDACRVGTSSLMVHGGANACIIEPRVGVSVMKL